MGDLVLIGCARGLDAQAESWRLRQPHRLGLPAGGAVGPHRLPAPDRSGLRRKGPIPASLRPRTGSEPAFRIARHGSGLFRVPASSLYGPFGYSESAKWAGQWSGHGAPTLWPLAAAGITKLVMGAPRPATQDLLVSVYRPRVRQRRVTMKLALGFLLVLRCAIRGASAGVTRWAAVACRQSRPSPSAASACLSDRT